MPVVAGIDIDGACEHAYEANNGDAEFYEQDVAETSSEQIKEYFGEADVQDSRRLRTVSAVLDLRATKERGRA